MAGEVILLQFKLMELEQHVHILLALQIGVTGVAVRGYHSLHQSFQFHALKSKVRIINFAILSSTKSRVPHKRAANLIQILGFSPPTRLFRTT